MLSKKKILVVEDHPINRVMLREILSSDYQVLEAENGEEGLAVLRTYGEEISLVLLDLIMPVMDGYTFLSLMKSDPAFANIPVIVTTQSDGEADEVAALSHGATDFVAKPYKPQSILHRVASIIRLRESAAMINLVQYDRLTGLYSKEFFYQKVAERLAQNPDQHYDIICSDVDSFKLINDVFGTQEGNRLLCGIGEIYQRRAGEWGICGRLHADQFVCLLERRWPYTEAIFQQVTDELNQLSSAGSLAMKWGIYQIGDRTVSAEQMCDRALLAARSIKGQYGKFFAYYDDALRSALLREQAITDSMAAALAGGQFAVYLQPKYRVEDSALAGAEALVRWNHPEWGMQSPAEFIPLFEKNGFITQLDQYVWEQACAALRSWDDQGLPPVSVSVNVSRADIYNADLTGILLRIVQKYGLSAARLHLEITESAYTENPRQIIDTVRRLRELGFVIEMDDFGSGYSSLNMLNELPIDVLKLDMKFIQSETAKPMNQGILRFIMDLARWMSLNVVAEGVETREQLERLREIGCDYVQGYYFARPMPCAEFETLLKKQRVFRAAPTPAQKAPMVTQRILLAADEDASSRAQMRETFSDCFQVMETADGASTLAAVEEYGPAAVILSMTMTDPDGASVLRQLRSDQLTWDIPVVATAPAGAEIEERALRLGADDFAPKPHTQISLRQRTMRVVSAAESWKQERLLRESAFCDPKTGLLNNTGLTAAIEGLRQQDAPLALYLVRVSGLSKQPDPEETLACFAGLLRSHTRESDLLAYCGEGEFAVVMRHMGQPDMVLRKSEEVDDAAKKRGLPLRLACGVALWSGVESKANLLGRARIALENAREGQCILWEDREP